jgi:hypothetical protein
MRHFDVLFSNLKATNLAAKDSNGFSDPYFSFEFGKLGNTGNPIKSFKSPVLYKSLFA